MHCSTTANEQKVVDAEVENRIAEKEKNGKKLTNKEKSKIEEKVINQLKEGAISVDTIEKTLAGDTYKKHQSAIEKEKALREEYEVIRNTPKDKLSYAQEERYAELKSQLENLESTKLKEQLDSEMRGITEKDDYLLESYYERARGEDAFTADLSKYDEKQRKIIKNAIDSGILNNKRSTHKVIDWIAKVAGEKGIDVDFANNERLKESGLAISDGQIINGFAQDGKVTYNLESAKVTEAVIGHEITHVFEGTDLYNELSDMITKYATANGTYESTIKALKKTYRTVYDETSADFDSKIQKEFVADFIGDTLFTDENFIAKLSEKPTLFSKVYDEIKYLAKSAKGTDAEKQLLDLQRKFEKMYRETEVNKESGIVEFSLVNKSITKDADIPYTINNSYQNVAANDTKALTKLQNDVKNIKRGTYENKATGYKADINATTIGKILYPKKSFDPWNPKYNYIENLNASLHLVELFENAVYIDSKPPQKTKNARKQIKEYHHFVAPIEMNNGDYRVLITAREKADSNTLYVVKTEILPNKKRGMPAAGQKPPTINDIPRTIKLADLVRDVKIYDYNTQTNKIYSDKDLQFSLSETNLTKDSSGRQLTVGQQEYFKNSKVRDENGNLKVMYHGTPNGDFTVFRDGTYFTENKDYADVYQSQGASSLGYKTTANNPKTYEVYLNIKKPFDTRNPKERAIFENEYLGQWGMGTPLMESGLPDWLDNDGCKFLLAICVFCGILCLKEVTPFLLGSK